MDIHAVSPTSERDDSDHPEPEPTKQSSSLWIFPALLGALVLVLNGVFPLNPQYEYAYRFGSWAGGANLILLFVSIFSGLFLIVYAFGLWRIERSNPTVSAQERLDMRHGSRFQVGVLVPLALSLVGVSTLWLGFMIANARFSPVPEAKPCVELFGDALTISKQRPTFRMPATDPDEIRCGINKTVFG